MAGGRLSLVLLALLAGTASAGEPERWEVDAERLVIDDGVLTGTGAVTMRVAGEVLTAEELVVDLDGRIATLTRGTWTTSAGDMRFEEATVSLETGTGEVRAGEFEASDGRILRGARLEIDADGAVHGEDVSWRPCAPCEGPEPWSVQARRVTLVPDEVLRAHGGWLRIFDVPLVPIPVAEVPLRRRSGFLAPDLRWGQQGLHVAAPLYLTLGRSADTTLTPELRSKRSIRLLSELRYALRGIAGQLTAAGGWDLVEQDLRGAASWSHRGQTGRLTHAVSTEVVSDLGVFRDYGDRFLDRSLPWSESRARIGLDSLALSTNTFQHAEPTLQDVLRVDLSPPRADWGGGVVGQLRGTAIARREATAPWGQGDWLGFGQLSGRVERPTLLGPFVAGPRIEGALARWTDGDRPEHEAVFAGLDAALPMWRDVPGHLERLELRISGGMAGPELAPAASAGLTWRRIGTTLVELRPRVSLQGETIDAVLDGTVRAGPWSVRLEGAWSPTSPERYRGVSWLAWDDGVLRLEAGAIVASADQVVQVDPESPEDLTVLQGAIGWRLPGPLKTVRVGASVRGDAEAPAWIARTASITWRHPTGCAELGLRGTLSTDRDLPDIALKVALTP